MPLLLRMLRLSLAFVFAVTVVGAAMAQEDAAPAEETPVEAAPAEDAAAEEPAPEVPDPLRNADIPIEELVVRLIPLTADQLAVLAEEWQGIVQDATQEVIDKQLEIAAAAEAGDADVVNEDFVELTQQRAALFEKYTAVVDSLENKGGSADAVAGYRAYRSAVLVEETQTADWRTLLQRMISWTTNRDGGIRVAIRAGIILASLAGLLIVARLMRGLAGRWFGKVRNLSKLLQTFLAVVVYWLTIAFGLMIVLSALGVDVTPLFALVGGASFIMAFAMQDTLSNLAAGLMIMFNRPFDEGDYVDIAGTGGTVKSVSVVSTTVTTPDNQVIVIPNSKVWGNVITNVTASDTRRVDLTFGIGYDDFIEEAQRVLEETVHAHPMVLKDPEPVIRVNALGASSVDFVCRPWVKAADYWTVFWDLTRQVKENFDRAGISIPYPQTDMHIHMRSDDKGQPAAAFAPPPRPSGASETVGDTPAERYAAGDDAADDEVASR